MHDLVLQELAHQLVDPVVEGRREQQTLSAGGSLAQDARHDGQEAQVGHVVGLVDDGHFDSLEVGDALTHEVVEAAGARDDDVDALAKRGLLRALRDAAEDRGDLQACSISERLDGCGDLRCQLTRGSQHEAAGQPAGALSVAESLHKRNRERERLAGAGLAAAEHVAACERVGKRVFLDGERVLAVHALERGHEVRSYAEIGE